MTLRSRPRPLRRLVIRADADAEAAVAEAELGTADALGNDEDMVAKVKARVLAKVAAKKAAKKKKLKEAGLLDEDEDEEGDEFAPVAAVPGQAKPKAKAKAKKKKRKYIKPDGTEVELEEDDDEDDEEEPYVAPPPPPVAPNKCTFHIEVETNFGDHLCLTGGHALLGDWSTVNGIPMDWVEGNKWSVTVNLPAHQLIQYKYVVRSGWAPDGDTRWQGGPDGIISTGPEHSTVEIQDKPQWHSWGEGHPSVKAVPAAVTAFQKVKAPENWPSNTPNVSLLPEWSRDAVFYQIFPLGYFGAPTVNDQKLAVNPRLKQIRAHYKHFRELGIDAVYFSPLFESGTHGYDTFDYFEIDRRLGDVELFKEIVKELHDIGIKVVLDGVFNHTGTQHFAFKDLKEKGAHASEFGNWFHIGARKWDYEGWCSTDSIKGTGFSYDCWEGHPVLPRLNLDEPAVRNHIFDVARFWLKEVGIDGWRLDVAHEIHPDFWREFRRVCDDARPDGSALLVGEMIHGNYNGWVGNDRLHSGTNYQMSHATWHSLNEHNYGYFYSALMREANLFSGLSLVNFLGNHDVPRIASNLDNQAHYTHAMVALILMKGIPCLYYGDEFGMEGRPEDGTDEHSGGDDAMRRPMLDCAKPASWPAVGMSRLALNKKLIALRKNYPVFGVKGTQDIRDMTLISNEQMIVIRYTEDEIAAMVFNCGDYSVDPWPEVVIPASFTGGIKVGDKMVDLLSPTGTSLPVHEGGKVYAGPCDPNSVKVLYWSKPKPKPKPKPAAAAVAATAGLPSHLRAAAAAGTYVVDPTAPTVPQPGIGEYDPSAAAAGAYGAMQDDMVNTLDALYLSAGAPAQATDPSAQATDPYAAMDAATDPYAAVEDAGAVAEPEAYDPYAAPPPPPSASYLDQFRPKSGKNIFSNDAMPDPNVTPDP